MKCFIKSNDDYAEQCNEPLASNSRAGIRDLACFVNNADCLRERDELL